MLIELLTAALFVYQQLYYMQVILRRKIIIIIRVQLNIYNIKQFFLTKLVSVKYAMVVVNHKIFKQVTNHMQVHMEWFNIQKDGAWWSETNEID